MTARAPAVLLAMLVTIAALALPRAARAQFETTEVSGPGSTEPFLLTKQDGWVWERIASTPVTDPITYNVYRKKPAEDYRYVAANLTAPGWAGDPESPVAEAWWYNVVADDTWGENRHGNGFPIELPAPCSGPPPVTGTPPLTLQSIRSGFSSPVFLASAPGDRSRLFVVEQGGRIRLLKRGVLQATAFLDVSTLVQCCGERGLLSMAFHPQYAQNGRFFVYYTRNSTGNTQEAIAEYHVAPSNLDQADATPGRVLLAVPHPWASNHNGGQIQFGPDGYLYIGTGDGGGGGDPQGNGQNTSSATCSQTAAQPCAFLGKLLRIDVDGALPYAVPATNPFVGDPTRLQEIWDFGLRNPWRFSFDRTTGDLYIGDVGQNQWEEVDVEPAGSPGGINYGWNVVEGDDHCYSPPTGCSLAGKVPPVADYSHSVGQSISGGYVYRGCRLPGYGGTYFYADYGSSIVRSFVYAGGAATNPQDWTSSFRPPLSSPSTFGQDANGELYVVSYAGTVFRIIPN